MLAVVVTSFERPLAGIERAIPSPGVGRVLERVKACGLDDRREGRAG